MTPRLVKQLLYGALYLLIIFIIFWLVYVFFFKPAPTCFDKIRNQGETGIDCGGPCPPCEITQLKPLSGNWALALPGRQKESSLLAEIDNPNPDFGARSFSYEFKVIGPFGALLQNVGGQSFIYPGETKYLLAPSLAIDYQNITRVELTIDPNSVSWLSNDKMAKPDLEIPSWKTTVSSGSAMVKGIIQNKNPLAIAQTKILAILYNASASKVLNASYTTLINLKGNSGQAFSVEFPKGDWVSQLNLNQTKIFIEPTP